MDEFMSELREHVCLSIPGAGSTPAELLVREGSVYFELWNEGEAPLGYDDDPIRLYGVDMQGNRLSLFGARCHGMSYRSSLDARGPKILSSIYTLYVPKCFEGNCYLDCAAILMRQYLSACAATGREKHEERRREVPF